MQKPMRWAQGMRKKQGQESKNLDFQSFKKEGACSSPEELRISTCCLRDEEDCSCSDANLCIIETSFMGSQRGARTMRIDFD
jgi:hypothetical protein